MATARLPPDLTVSRVRKTSCSNGDVKRFEFRVETIHTPSLFCIEEVFYDVWDFQYNSMASFLPKRPWTRDHFLGVFDL